ncbi:hypothetical protein FJY93_01135 [Candidatus Kaiserbacteria bacterium]|nr:hypothetical protein [Candidatus Kaiserbacteria bacterium]
MVSEVERKVAASLGLSEVEVALINRAGGVQRQQLELELLEELKTCDMARVREIYDAASSGSTLEQQAYCRWCELIDQAIAAATRLHDLEPILAVAPIAYRPTAKKKAVNKGVEMLSGTRRES